MIISWIDERTCQVTFDVAQPADAIGDASSFSVESETGVPMTVYRTKPGASLDTSILKVGPAVFPGVRYTIRFSRHSATEIVPQNISPQDSLEWSHGLLDALTETFGEAVQRFSGRPQTLVVTEYKPDDPCLFVESTLGFPASGRLFIGGREYRYGSKGPMEFSGFHPLTYSNMHIAQKEVVTLNVRAIKPL